MSAFRDKQVQLPGSRIEIRNIAQLVKGDYLYGKAASEKTFKKLAPAYQVLHLAVHGITDDGDPENSKLDFFTEPDSIEDGELHAFELYGMDLNADLAVLSACDTGNGKIISGEGTMSLDRAFAYAGVNSLLLSRCQISDNFTPEIMKVFYRELKDGKTKSKALRAVKLEFLKNGDNITVKPFYWNGFYILGDNSPIEFKSENLSLNYYFGTAIIILMILLMLRKFILQRKQKST